MIKQIIKNKTENIKDSVKKASLKYQYHHSIKILKLLCSKKYSFYSSQFVLIDKVENKIKTLNTKKPH